MYPNDPQYQTASSKQARIKKWLLISLPVLFVVFVVLVLVTAFWPQPDLKQYNLSHTAISAEDNFGHLQGDSLYAYNGFAFYETNLDSGKTTILSSGLKLPAISDVYWAGSKGALLSFSASFNLTAVTRALEQKGEAFDYYQSPRYAWYLDFATNELKLVSRLEVSSGQAHYSPQENGFFFVTVANPGSGSLNRTPLYFYDVASNQTKRVHRNLKVSDMGRMQACPGEGRVCFVARDFYDTDTESVFALTQDNKTKILYESQGRLFATNHPQHFIEVPNQGRVEDPENERDTPTDVTYDDQPAVLRDITADTNYDLGFSVGTTNPIMHFVDQQHFYVLDSGVEAENGGAAYLSGTIKEGDATTVAYPLLQSNQEPFSSRIVGGETHGNGSRTLVVVTDGSLAVFSERGQAPPPLQKADIQPVSQAVKQCMDASGATDQQYYSESNTFRVFFTADNSFDQNIARFADCLAASDAAPMIGYMFNYAGVSPVNGRIVTN